MGATLEHGTDLDQDKTAISSTLGIPPGTYAEDSVTNSNRHSVHWRHRTPVHSPQI